MNHPLAGAQNHGRGRGVAVGVANRFRALEQKSAATSSKEGTGYTFSFVIVGNLL